MVRRVFTFHLVFALDMLGWGAEGTLRRIDRGKKPPSVMGTVAWYGSVLCQAHDVCEQSPSGSGRRLQSSAPQEGAFLSGALTSRWGSAEHSPFP